MWQQWGNKGDISLRESIQVHLSNLGPITKECDDVNVIAAELRLTRTRPASLYKRHNLLEETMPTDVNKVLETKC